MLSIDIQAEQNATKRFPFHSQKQVHDQILLEHAKDPTVFHNNHSNKSKTAPTFDTFSKFLHFHSTQVHKLQLLSSNSSHSTIVMPIYSAIQVHMETLQYLLSIIPFLYQLGHPFVRLMQIVETLERCLYALLHEKVDFVHARNLLHRFQFERQQGIYFLNEDSLQTLPEESHAQHAHSAMKSYSPLPTATAHLNYNLRSLSIISHQHALDWNCVSQSLLHVSILQRLWEIVAITFRELIEHQEYNCEPRVNLHPWSMRAPVQRRNCRVQLQARVERYIALYACKVIYWTLQVNQSIVHALLLWISPIKPEQRAE
mmetsp:Transcript_2360/g.4132  ORF Transcript_2360/g.4132 Transcript_2360/m.4132 type:complete len:315 (-) Transcript_2360:1466-2410(-)